MCGIAGIISQDVSAVGEINLKKMTTALAHRGPDGEACWINSSGRVGLGHRRLSIIDLSDAAAQPMHHRGRFTIIHNGEIYNYLELKELLIKQDFSFRTHSDTEVILAAYDYWGSGCLDHFDGMFAFAIWDEEEQMLFCARDRFGEKPFFYAADDRRFCFASEAKGLWAAGIDKRVNNPLLLNYLVLGQAHTPADNTITFFQDIFSLPAAHCLRFRLSDFSIEIRRYWDCDKEAKNKIKEEAAIEQFSALLADSVKKRLRSDVRLGTSLSGGLDSSTVAATIRGLRPDQEIPAFSAVFPGFEFDESNYIRHAAEAFHLEACSVKPTSDELVIDFGKLCFHQEIPFISSSVFAQYKVFETASQRGVKVLLDGQGADETLAGYTKYVHWYLQELISSRSKKFMSEKKALARNQLVFRWSAMNVFAAWFPAQATYQLEKREKRKLAHFSDIKAEFRNEYLDRQSIFKPIVFKLNDILYFNTCQSGLEELLRYADRNSMTHGREVRLPFLSHELVQFVFSLPSSFKIRQGYTKWLLRK
ncbi:MAG TPA: asparagine synthase (glutamine-hydrolyzing), partial [Puia sp.]|nr:asparagine synthase (glutamine-hydrolyzing) [Puia sp.]